MENSYITSNQQEVNYLWHCGFDYIGITIIQDMTHYIFEDSFALQWAIGEFEDIQNHIPTIILTKIQR